MRLNILLAVVLVLVLAASVCGMEKKVYQMKEDFGTEPLYNCYMNYWYYIPCAGTTGASSWFWSYTGWDPGDIIGVFFTVGDPSMWNSTCAGGSPEFACNPDMDHTIEQFRILDFAGYGTIYPGLFTVEFDIWCSTADGCPIVPSLWNSGPFETAYAWNYITVNPPLCVSRCSCEPNYRAPRFLITATMIGTNATYPAWGMDNISIPVQGSCLMHDGSTTGAGCCPALYPRPAVSHYPTMHSGYYGPNFQYCPPAWFLDGNDTTGDVYGFIELAWRVYLVSSGPTATEPSTWGHIKSMYR